MTTPTIVYPVLHNIRSPGKIIGVFQSEDIAKSIIKDTATRLNLNQNDFVILNAKLDPRDYTINVIRTYKKNELDRVTPDEKISYTREVPDYSWSDIIWDYNRRET